MTPTDANTPSGSGLGRRDTDYYGLNRRPAARSACLVTSGTAPEVSALVTAGIEMVLYRRLAEVPTSVLQGVSCVVLDAEATAAWTLSAVPQWPANTPIVLHILPTERFAGVALRASRRAVVGTISVPGWDDLGDDVMHIVRAGVPPSPAFQMLRDLDSSVAPRNVLGILTGALALCRHRIHLEDLAEACEIPVRTIQWRFARAFERGGGDLIGWSISLSTIWMLEVLNWPLKECARRIGFGDTSTLAAYVARHVGQRPRQILASGGFDLLSRRWLTVWAQKPNAQVVLGNPG